MYNYHDYVVTLSTRFNAVLSEIAAIHNFDLGDEFEIALCKILRNALPEKFGICRGHIVDAEGREAGDDIIIYDSQRFPTLRLHYPRNDFSRKEWIPIEATYACIEANHTLQIEGDGGSSLKKAINQISYVKKLCNTRESVPMTAIRPGFHFPEMGLFKVTVPNGFPSIQNPCFTAIIARQVRQKENGPILNDSTQIKTLLEGVTFPIDSAPDFIIAGSSNVVLPIIWQDNPLQTEFASPFYLPGLKRPLSHQMDQVAYGMGICLLLYALDWIQLGSMNWNQIILNAESMQKGIR